MKAKIFLAATLLLSLFFNTTIFSCTAFLLKSNDELVFGRNYDFIIGYGIVFTNKKDVVKTAFTETNTPATWVSKYGSVTFNQFGREFPTGGMNETGLVVELMWLDDTKYPEKDGRAATGGVLQWIQYQLDNCQNIQEVIETDKDIRIPTRAVPIHFLIADKYGNSATIEFLNGKMVPHSGNELPFPVLTNDTYEGSLDYLNSNRNQGGIQNADYERSSLNRFVKACSLIQNYNKESNGNAVDYGFRILSDVDQGSHTKWSIIYDINNMKIYFRTYDNDKVKNLELGSLDFSCSSPVKMIDINSDLEGNINASMTDYSYDSNRQLIEDSYDGVDFLRNTGSEERDLSASYPEKLKCRSKSGLENNSVNNIGNMSENKIFKGEIVYVLSGAILTTVIFAGLKIRKKRSL